MRSSNDSESRQKRDLLIDIGNSNTKFCEWDGHRFYKTTSLTTAHFRDTLHTFYWHNWQEVLLASVVPDIHKRLTHIANMTQISVKNIPKLTINLSTPEQLGADRIVVSYAAWERFHTDVLILDSGTAVTTEFVTRDGVYEGGLIFPGMDLCSRALNLYTAQIPRIRVKPVDTLFGKTTREAVQAGIYVGFYHMLNGIISQYRETYPDITVIGTGGGLGLFSDKLSLDHYIPDLIFEGLALCASRNAVID